ncbi:TonB-dependent siderophore receptor [Altericroceibacterium spongiae]|uniref:TonB-dependent siderophore receptor n=1 Tax=Altericroceibacterium spongiae TaxID=2320269 RepID=A0A420ES08_9SPHN|nr:TonB-dependent receptor [Altericroceibacterium spongiae]RKF23449.1 TonB-dependent siderophore receptor [Altericroceibacterium spongiae]
MFSRSLAPWLRKNHLHGMLLSSAMIAVSAMPVAAQAQRPVEAEAAKTHFSVPAQELDSALTSIADRGGIRIFFASAELDGARSAPVSGTMSVEQALSTALTGTGFTWRYREPGTVVIEKAPETADGAIQLGPVRVQGAGSGGGDYRMLAGDGSAESGYRVENAEVGALGSRSIQDTPFSIDVYSQELIENLQISSVADLAKVDASINPSRSSIYGENNLFAIRGLQPDSYSGIRIDGLAIRSRAFDLPFEHFESVSVLKGAGGFLYGFGSPGGTVNYQTKRAGKEPVRSVTAGFTNDSLWRVHGDLGARIGANDAFGYRVNIVHEEGDTPVDGVESERTSGSLALDWRVTPELTVSFDGLKTQHVRTGLHWSIIPNQSGAYNGYTLGEPPEPIDGSTRLAPGWTRYGSRTDSYSGAAEWEFTPGWTISARHRWTDNVRQFFAPSIFANADGDYGAGIWRYNNKFESKQTEAMLRGGFATGAITHNLTLGGSLVRTSDANTPSTSVVLGTGNLSDPTLFDQPAGFDFLDFDTATSEYNRTRRQEVFLSDTVGIGESVDLILGVRHGEIKDYTSDYAETATTPSFAAIWRPVSWLSAYATYVESLERGSVAGATYVNAGEVFSPTRSEQYEFGVKAVRGDWTAELALFRLDRALTYVTSANEFTQDGRARYQGVELSGAKRFGERLLVLGGVTYLDAVNRKTTDPTLEHEAIRGIAEWQGNLRAEYELAALPLTMTGGMQYIGERPVDFGGQWDFDDVAIFDLGARYETGAEDVPLTLRLTVDNLFDAKYWNSQANGYSTEPGEPRTFRFSIEADF